MSDEIGSVSACVICTHRAIWHHDERGCQYHGNSPENRCVCRRNSDQVVSRIVYEAMHKASDQWLIASVEAGNE